MPEGGSRWASGGTRRKSKGVEDLYTSCARDAPQKKLWVRIGIHEFSGKMHESHVRIVVHSSTLFVTLAQTCTWYTPAGYDTITPVSLQVVSCKQQSSTIMIHQVHRLRHWCCNTTAVRIPYLCTVFADIRRVWYAAFNIVLAAVCSNQNHLHGGSRRRQELPHQAILRREGE